MIINKLQLITNYLDVEFLFSFYFCIYNVILKLQKNNRKRNLCYCDRDTRKKKRLT